MSIKRALFVQNETGQLKTVVLGIAHDQGEELEINPVSKHHKKNGTYPTEKALIAELQTVEKALLQEGIEVLRPKNLPKTEQIFTRDIGFVIDDKFIISNMREPVRQPEIEGIEWILHEIGQDCIIKVPEEATIEGGDVILCNDQVFVGISKRTNWAGFEFLRSQFPGKQFHPIELKVTDDHKTNVLHLDCVFQPVGEKHAIIYPDGFANTPGPIYDLFNQEHRIEVTQEQMNQMYPNIFSIAPDKVLVERSFTALIKQLEEVGIECIPVSYAETSKLSGLLRCSTLPLLRV